MRRLALRCMPCRRCGRCCSGSCRRQGFSSTILRAQHADPGDLHLQHVAGLHEQLRIAAVADALRRAGGDHVAGRERGEVGAERHDVRDRIDQEIGAGALHLLAVEPRHQRQLGRVGDFVGGDHPWAQRPGAGKILARGHREFLEVAHAAVDEAGVAGDMLERALLRDVAAALADHHRQLALEIELRRDRSGGSSRPHGRPACR